ncbi:hypothetical protein Q9Q94_05270 [Uliginosibacterium sp. 31-16]|uniref:hypothetical protein n=1 Tax=Uliginosibacterium sp. 31-16 TaxID=3068315 RepID=UPI00273F1BA3|nr:hypothetical protein [Uliginosibacterium sp. 31-16]MDP5238928.1 hypothetical protein [Uliginosibacterium sp. 31-16]
MNATTTTSHSHTPDLPTRASTDAAPPPLRRRMQVTLMDQQFSGFGLGCLGAMIGAAPGFALMFWGISDESWWAMLLGIGGMLLALIGMLAGFGLILFGYEKLRGVPDFSQKVLVEARPEGLAIEGYRLIPWREIAGYEGVPDSDSHLIVHASPWSLMLDDDAGLLARSIGWHLNASNSLNPQAGGGCVRALLFRRWRFLAWIVAGYVLPAAVVIASLPENNKGLLGVLALVFVVGPLLAWLIWAIPLATIGLLAGPRMRTFYLDGALLHSTDGHWQIDLRSTRLRSHRASGIGYEFGFVSLHPARGRSLHLIPIEGQADALLGWLEKARRRAEQTD